ncbi:MAG: PIG-L family deacetylase [Acidobacteria bacterium]|nr:PIG-L family deacetylase [Acidobacteriota bacterium]
MQKKKIREILILVQFVLAAGFAMAQIAPPPDAARRRIALEKLLVTGRALYIGAHPDDENTAMLAWLTQGRKLSAAYLSLTRGDGGQNLIGAEQGDALSVIRTEELLAARKLDGAEQLFTRAADFGFSKTPEETLRFWGRDRILADIVYAIRSFRPDVLITRFPTSGDGGHGHHTASAQLALEAYTAAADPARFSEQLSRVSPWRSTRLFWNAWTPPGAEKPRSGGSAPILTVDLGVYNPVLGQSYVELAASSRSMHKSQGFGSPARRGFFPNYLELLAGSPASGDPFDGIDLSWGRYAGGAAVEAALKEALAAYSDLEPHRSVPALIRALTLAEKLPDEPLTRGKRAEIVGCIRDCAGLWLESVTDSPSVTRGAAVKITLSLLRRSPLTVRCARVEMPFGAPPAMTGITPEQNILAQADATVTIPPGLAYSNPYWLEGERDRGVTAVPDESLRGLPHNPPPIVVRFVLEIEGREVAFDVPVQHRWTDPVEGERYRDATVVPEVTVSFENHAVLFSGQGARSVRMVARAQRDGASARVSFACPQGWTVTPRAVEVAFSKRGEERSLRVEIAPPAAESSGELRVSLATAGHPEEPARQFLQVDHPHIPVQVLLPVASVRLVRAELTTPVHRVGYVMGAGDDIPGMLRQLGVDVTLLTDADLEETDLSRFDAIVTGVRAFNTRPRLGELSDALLRYVDAGGTLVVQYNTNRDLVAARIAPFPLELSRDRTTDESASVTLLRPDHPILVTPHRIRASDFEGWVQERGLYYPGKWDDRFTPLLEMGDPGETPSRGAVLVTPSGKGMYVYTGISFFRQLPAGVPGAIRLFLNLLGGGRARG